MSYVPPFEITNRIINLISEISERLGRVHVTNQLQKSPTLRRKNRIQTIYSSLAIEQNTMTIDQVTAVLNGKRVLAPPKDIEEVKNAYEIYEHLDELNPYKIDDLLRAHEILMRGLVKEYGMFRTRPVGVVNSQSGEIIHFGAMPEFVPSLVNELFTWAENTDIHPLIVSSVIHYELEFIHPFQDGNGRIGRLWHTLCLSKWNKIFAWIPVESIIQQRQQEYYDVINLCNAKAESTDFIEFMLSAVKSALDELEENTCPNGTSDGTSQEQGDNTESVLEFCLTPRTRAEIQSFCGIESRKSFTNKILKPLLESGKLKMTIPDKPTSQNQKYVYIEEGTP